MTKKIGRVVSILVLVLLAISISAIMLVYNGKKDERPYSAKLVNLNIDWRDDIGQEEKEKKY